MLYRIFINGVEKKVFNYAIQKSMYFSVCVFKHTKSSIVTEKYKNFLSAMKPFEFEPIKVEFAPYQHYRSGQKFIFFRINPSSISVLINNKEFSCWNFPDMPEDVAFYNGKQAWLYYISHEDLLYLRTEDTRILEQLKSIGCTLVAQT